MLRIDCGRGGDRGRGGASRRAREVLQESRGGMVAMSRKLVVREKSGG